MAAVMIEPKNRIEHANRQSIMHLKGEPIHRFREVAAFAPANRTPELLQK